MKPISEEVIREVSTNMENMPDEELVGLMQGMWGEQPEIMSFLMITGRELSEEEQSLLLFYGISIWRMILSGDRPPARVTEEILAEAENSNLRLLEQFDRESETGQTRLTDSLMGGYNQIGILNFVLGAILGEPANKPYIREENSGLLVFSLKTVIDCFDRDHLVCLD